MVLPYTNGNNIQYGAMMVCRTSLDVNELTTQ